MDGHRKIIRENRQKLVETVDLMKTSILDELVQKEVISEEQLASLKQTCSNNIQRVSAILDHLHSRPSEDWSTFLKCLSNRGYGFLVKELSSPDADFRDLQRLVARKIRDQYRMVKPWSLHGQCDSVPIEDIFVDVVLKCTIPTSSNVLASYREVFKKFSEAATIHIYGEPGTGKSLLATRLCFDWVSQHARGGRTKLDLSRNVGDLKFVLPVYLKDVKQEHTFLDFVAYSYGLEMEDAEDLCNCIEKYQESILLVFDGLDEYDGISEEITKILQRNMYPRIKMLITSRNSMVEDIAIRKYAPDLELTLHGFSDDGIQEYIQKTCQEFRDMEAMLLDIKNLNYLDCLSHNPAFLLLIINLWHAALNKGQPIQESSFFREFVAYAVGRKENKQERLNPIRKSTDLLIWENHGLIMSFGKLASTSVKEDRMDQEFSLAEVSEHIGPGDLRFGFLIKKRQENGQYVYTFVHKAIQDMFLSYFIAKSPFTDQERMALLFCECQEAFKGSDISRFLSSYGECTISFTIEALCSGNEGGLARSHTDLQLRSLENNDEANLVLPKATYLTIYSTNCKNVNKYFSKDGSRLEILTVRSHEKFLCLLSNLTAPNLTCLNLSNSEEIVYNVEQGDIEMIVPALVQFRLKTFEIKLCNFSDKAKSAVAQAACQIETLECLSFTEFSLSASFFHTLKKYLPKSNLKTLAILKCGLILEQLLEVIDVIPLCSALQNLDVSRNYIDDGVEILVNKTDNFRHLQKLDLSLNLIPAEIKQKIKESLQCYPELELKIEKQSDFNG